MGTLTGPVLDSDLWPRLGGAISRAARQLEHDRRSWAVLQDNGSLAWATPWSQHSLTVKLQTLTSHVRNELARHPLAGVVLTTGPRNTAGPAVAEDSAGAGCIALRRQLVGQRSRETFIICATPLQKPGPGLDKHLPHPDAQALYHAYATETDWLDHYLASRATSDR